MSPEAEPLPLRAVGEPDPSAPAPADSSAAAAPPPAGSAREPRRNAAIPWILAGLLAISLLLLGWSRAQLGQRVAALEDEARNLREAVAVRDRTIDAQRARLGDVRSRVEGLLETLDAPLED